MKFLTSLCTLFLISFTIAVGMPEEALAASATKAVQERQAAEQTIVENAGAGNSGNAGKSADLQAVVNPEKKPTTFTGLPQGALPGDNIHVSPGTMNLTPPSRIAIAGQPLLSPINETNIGKGLNQIGDIADQVGYKLVVRKNYKAVSPTDPPYSLYLMKGKQRIKTLFFNSQLKLCDIR